MYAAIFSEKNYTKFWFGHILGIFFTESSGHPVLRYILQYAAIRGGVVVSNDHFRDFLGSGEPALDEVIRCVPI
jgi:hypothetical protein